MSNGEVELASEARTIELEIIEAAKDLARYEDGALSYGLGRLSVSRNSYRGDGNLHKITNGARRLLELSEVENSQPTDSPAELR